MALDRQLKGAVIAENAVGNDAIVRQRQRREGREVGPCSVRWWQYLMVREGEKWTLFDLAADPGETTDLARQQSPVIERLAAAYDVWWNDVLPCLVNEDAYKTATRINPFKSLYWRQFAGPEPNNAPPP